MSNPPRALAGFSTLSIPPPSSVPIAPPPPPPPTVSPPRVTPPRAPPPLFLLPRGPPGRLLTVVVPAAALAAAAASSTISNLEGALEVVLAGARARGGPIAPSIHNRRLDLTSWDRSEDAEQAISSRVMCQCG